MGNQKKAMQRQIEEILREYLIPEENYIYGFAELTGLLDRKFMGFNYGISIGRRLDNSIVENITDGPTKEYYSHYRQINEELALRSGRICARLSDLKIENVNIPPTVSTAELDTIYFQTLRTDLSHKMVATRAGLGWIGKTDLLITRKFGPRLRLTSILLKERVIPESKPIDISRCGTCNICVEICPAQAANGKMWDISIDREEFFDASKCRTQCAEFGRSRLSMDARVCGMCVAACPVGLESRNN
ncbi:MAG: epoxyqueuosine reductase [Bacteroidales bacterium]|nr:epoxyqueuosine reductase [Bacteroidales bacterium]